MKCETLNLAIQPQEGVLPARSLRCCFPALCFLLEVITWFISHFLLPVSWRSIFASEVFILFLKATLVLRDVTELQYVLFKTICRIFVYSRCYNNSTVKFKLKLIQYQSCWYCTAAFLSHGSSRNWVNADAIQTCMYIPIWPKTSTPLDHFVGRTKQ